jgi:hypothetical protein
MTSCCHLTERTGALDLQRKRPARGLWDKDHEVELGPGRLAQANRAAGCALGTERPLLRVDKRLDVVGADGPASSARRRREGHDGQGRVVLDLGRERDVVDRSEPVGQRTADDRTERRLDGPVDGLVRPSVPVGNVLEEEREAEMELWRIGHDARVGRRRRRRRRLDRRRRRRRRQTLARAGSEARQGVEDALGSSGQWGLE